jgi:hypothetical protein
MKKQKGAKILYFRAVNNFYKNVNTLNGAQKLSAHYSTENSAQIS